MPDVTGTAAIAASQKLPFEITAIHAGNPASGVIFNIQRYSLHDGPGIRTTLFFKGCPLRCWWCHNPESQVPDPQTLPDSGDNSAELGRRMTPAEVLQEIAKDVLFFDESEGGVTFSGGEPLMQPEFLISLLQGCAAQGVHTAIDTCGYAQPEIFQRVLAHVDLALYDVKILDDTAHRHYTGASNQRILENLRLLSESGTPYSIRFPVIPGITDTQANITALLTLLSELHGVQQINLLPYHRTAAHKYDRLRLHDQMMNIDPPRQTWLQTLKAHFEAHGFWTQIGG